MKRILSRTPEIAGDSETLLPLLRVCTDEKRSYGDVITKFSRPDGLPIFLTDGAFLGALRTLKLRCGFMKFLIWARGEGRRRRERYKFELHGTMKNNRFARFARALSKT